MIHKKPKKKKHLNEKTVKITKREHAFKSYASTYNVNTLNSFNPDLQLEDTLKAFNDFRNKQKKCIK